jgi:hypothetical protein
LLAWIGDRAEINIRAANKKNISDFSLLSEEFGALELTAKCNIFSFFVMAVSNFQDYNQQIEAISCRIRRLEERVSSSMLDRMDEPEQFRKECGAKLAQMKSEWENENTSLVTHIETVEWSVS